MFNIWQLCYYLQLFKRLARSDLFRLLCSSVLMFVRMSDLTVSSLLSVHLPGTNCFINKMLFVFKIRKINILIQLKTSAPMEVKLPGLEGNYDRQANQRTDK